VGRARPGGRVEQYGKYELLAPLAVGGMAQIFLARERMHNDVSRQVVIKRMLPQYAGDPSFVKMFLDEARLVARLNHPNICHQYDFGAEGDTYYIAMEWVDGVSLRELIRRSAQEGGLPIPFACRILAAVADGLHHAHEARDEQGKLLGIIHRDISPSNIMIRFDGVVKLLDFGVAKVTSDAIQTDAGIVKGKFSYMSPEQCRGDALDARSDLFGLGICLYEALTQASPFRRKNALETVRAIVQQDAPPPSSMRPATPPHLDTITMRALKRAPEERFESAEEMLCELEHHIRESGHFVRPSHIATYLRALFPGGRDSVESAESASASPPTAKSSHPPLVPRPASTPPSTSPSTPLAATNSSRPPVPRPAPTPSSRPPLSPPAMAAKKPPATLLGDMAIPVDVDFDDEDELEDLPTQLYHTDALPERIATELGSAVPEKPAEAERVSTMDNVPLLDVDGPVEEPTEETGLSAFVANPLLSEARSARRPLRRTIIAGAGLLIVVAAMVLFGVMEDGDAAVAPGYAAEPDRVAHAEPSAPSVAPGDLEEAEPSDVVPVTAEGTVEAPVDTDGEADSEANDELVAETPEALAPQLPTLAEAEEATAESGEASAFGTLSVTTRPARAMVRIGDRRVLSPAYLDGIPVGAHRVTIVRNGYQAVAKEVEILPGETAELHVTLRARPTGMLNIDSRPPSQVYLGGRLLGETPLRGVEVPSGSIRLSLVTSDGTTSRRLARIQPGRTTRLFVPLGNQ